MSKFWDRLRRAQKPDFTHADESLTAARQRLVDSHRQLDVARELKRKSDETLKVNHFSSMIEETWGKQPRRQS